VESACARLSDLGYLDDAALADSLVRRRRRAGRGSALIASELRHRGIGDAVIAAALRTVDPEQEREVLMATAQRLARRHADLCPAERWGRVGAALRRRGHSTEAIERALQRMADC
jgi:regulatory protein